jgi:hypothetical protein
MGESKMTKKVISMIIVFVIAIASIQSTIETQTSALLSTTPVVIGERVLISFNSRRINEIPANVTGLGLRSNQISDITPANIK